MTVRSCWRSNVGTSDSPAKGFGFLNASLDFANGVQIIVDPGAIAQAERQFQAMDLLRNPIETARGCATDEAGALDAWFGKPALSI
jgi:hypothetical protein